ncbi:glutathione synthetase [Roseivirga sp. BDSF3-8]|uniref:glutathione synthetase n=1 Tax=Roseivirga sp. BDSF3-8 TaxID=3241598 RepID=UPI0035321712
MKICFVLNDIAVESCGTSLLLMKKAHERGHEVFVMSVGDYVFRSDTPLSVNCIKIPPKLDKKDPEEFLEAIQSDKLKHSLYPVTDFDVLFIRNNPTEEPAERYWAEQSGVAFGRMAQNLDVLVLNDAYAMSNAFIDKLYFEELPEEIKPKSLITRNREDLLNFWEEVGKKMVLKPLQGSGGQNVFLIDKTEKNINQIIDTIMEDGYVIAQEYLPKAKDGDVRVFLMNGRLLEQDGKLGLIRRKSGEGEFRSNFSVGGSAENSELTDAMKRIIRVTAPKLIRDGLFFVGLDVVGDKLIEINVLSPGGFEHFRDLKMPDFTDTVIDSIERKVEYKRLYEGLLSNRTLATMD